MRPWTDDQVWNAIDAWRWVPPASTKKTCENFDLTVTPGSYALTYAYGLHARDGPDADAVVRQLRKEVESLGGTGVRVRVTPRSSPPDLAQRLAREGYTVVEDAEVLAWELRDETDRPRLPIFRPVEGVVVREVRSDAEFGAFLSLSQSVFGDPTPSAESLRGFREIFQQKMRTDEGHSDRFVAWRASEPIGRAGMEIAGDVARFWGTGVLSPYRGRGVYGALVQARCVDAVRRGAKLALVTARTGTSGPILKRHGFRVIGSLWTYEARWNPRP